MCVLHPSLYVSFQINAAQCVVYIQSLEVVSFYRLGVVANRGGGQNPLYRVGAAVCRLHLVPAVVATVQCVSICLFLYSMLTLVFYIFFVCLFSN